MHEPRIQLGLLAAASLIALSGAARSPARLDREQALVALVEAGRTGRDVAAVTGPGRRIRHPDLVPELAERLRGPR